MAPTDVESGYGSVPSVQPSLRKQYSSHWRIGRKQSHESLHGISPAAVHNDFVIRVYTLLACELLLTAAICSLMMFVKPLSHMVIAFVNTWTLTYQILMLVSMASSMLFLLCVKNQYPVNMFALSLFVAIASVNVGVPCCLLYEEGSGQLIMMAIAITAAIFIVITLYAWCCTLTEVEFSYIIAFLLVACFASLVLAIVQLFVHTEFLNLVFCWLGILVFSAYILIDTVMIKTKLGPDDAIVASIDLFLDFLNLFLYILQLLDECSKK